MLQLNVELYPERMIISKRMINPEDCCREIISNNYINEVMTTRYEYSQYSSYRWREEQDIERFPDQSTTSQWDEIFTRDQITLGRGEEKRNQLLIAINGNSIRLDYLMRGLSYVHCTCSLRSNYACHWWTIQDQWSYGTLLTRWLI